MLRRGDSGRQLVGLAALWLAACAHSPSFYGDVYPSAHQYQSLFAGPYFDAFYDPYNAFCAPVCGTTYFYYPVYGPAYGPGHYPGRPPWHPWPGAGGWPPPKPPFTPPPGQGAPGTGAAPAVARPSLHLSPRMRSRLMAHMHRR